MASKLDNAWFCTSLLAAIWSCGCESPEQSSAAPSSGAAGAEATGDPPPISGGPPPRAAMPNAPAADAGGMSDSPAAGAGGLATAARGAPSAGSNAANGGAGASAKGAAGEAPAAGEGGGGGDGAAAPMQTDEIPSADSFPRLEASQLGTPKVISTEFDLAESPIWDHCEQRLLFSDVNNRKIHSFVLGGEIGSYMEGTNYVNGMIFDPDGFLLMAEMGGGRGGRITRMGRDKKIQVVIDRDPMGGMLQTTDDLTLRSDGTIYFTDPIISHGPYWNDLASLVTHPIYRLKPGMGEREIVRESVAQVPNGIRLSRDEKFLFVAAYLGDEVLRFDVAADGSLGEPKVFATGLDAADSMCLDIAGNIYVGVRSGLQVLRPDGSKVKLIPIRANDRTTNCGFGGPDGKTLFITAWTAFLQLDDMPVPGLDWYEHKNIKCN